VDMADWKMSVKFVLPIMLGTRSAKLANSRSDTGSASRHWQKNRTC
jgi:hypothetical protein